jgi:ABC-2 type transport system ATP-binding protein
MIEISNISKTYPNGVHALDNVSLSIPVGLYGLLGPNGAGKSSLMRTIATLQEPDSGSVLLNGVDVIRQKDAMRATLGYLPQEFGFYPTLSGEATLDHFAELKGIKNSKERKELTETLLRQVNLWDARKKAVGGYSGGMKQRLGIAIALVGNPGVIIVDEPTAGLDPTERNRFLNLLAEAGERAAVILSTHIVEDVQELCERVAIIAKGRVVAHGTPETVIADVSGKLFRRTVAKHELGEIEKTLQVVSKRLVAGKPVVTVTADECPAGFDAVKPGLEDAYFLFTADGAK